MALARFIATVFPRWRNARFRSNPLPEHLQLGIWGEKQAARFLRRNRFKILYRNFRAPQGGEIDLVCRDRQENALVFIEVKTRTSEDFGRPTDAVDEAKRRLILRGAMAWLRMLDMPDIAFRFDVLEVLAGSPPKIHHVRNAFYLPDDYAY